MRLFLTLSVILLTALVTAGCNASYNSKASYFGGALLADYQQSSSRDSCDNFTLTFFEPGSYHVAFSQTPGTVGRDGHGPEVMPKDFDVTIAQAPRARVVSQYNLPDYLRVTITRDGRAEFYDF